MALRMDLTTSDSTILTDKNRRIYDRDETGDDCVVGKNHVTVFDDDLGIDNDNEGATLARVRNEESSNGDSKKREGFFVKYRGKIYEISDLLAKHPGGRKNLFAFRGLTLDKVLTDVPHSDAAFHLFEEFVVDNQRKYDDIENLVDWNEPLLGQVGKLADRYWEWMNLPVNRSIRLFESNFLENLTITPWYIVPIIWIPISIYFLYLGISANNSENVKYSVAVILLAISWGFLLWTFVEYVLHRNLFHMKPPPHSKTLITLHFLLHGVHHKAPFDDRRLLFPPAGTAIVATIFFYFYRAVFPDIIVYFIAAGTMTGYLCYDLIHYYLHHGSPRAESYLYVMKRHHNHHHFSHHHLGFGISSRLWDIVFGSLIPLKKLRNAIVW